MPSTCPALDLSLARLDTILTLHGTRTTAASPLHAVQAALQTARAALCPSRSPGLQGIMDAISHIAASASFSGLQSRPVSARHAAAAALCLCAPMAFAQVRSPLDYAAHGTFAPELLPLTINTDTATITYQNGGGQQWQGELRDSVAVFCFDQITIQSGAIIRLVGARPLVMLSRTSFNLGGQLAARPQTAYSTNFLTSGFAGLGYGLAGGGAGGYAATANFGLPGGPGGGLGGGAGGRVTSTAGSGGGFGGRGGGPAGGEGYGDLLVRLEGGSGGGGSRSPEGYGLYGGGGGGAVELGAMNDLAINGYIVVPGGSTDANRSGGGGSGGGILLHASTVHFGPDAVAYAGGGTASPPAGSGSGGRIAVQSVDAVVSTHLNVARGDPGAENGVITIVHPHLSVAAVIDFGNVPLNGSRTLAVAAVSDGDAGSSVSGRFGPAPVGSAFTLNSALPFSTVRAGQTAAGFYTFAPTAAGEFSQVVTITSDAGPVTFTLHGVGGPGCVNADADGDGDVGTDADIEAFFRVLAGGHC